MNFARFLIMEIPHDLEPMVFRAHDTYMEPSSCSLFFRSLLFAKSQRPAPWVNIRQHALKGNTQYIHSRYIVDIYIYIFCFYHF